MIDRHQQLNIWKDPINNIDTCDHVNSLPVSKSNPNYYYYVV